VLVSSGRLVVKTPTFPFTPATTSDWFYDYERARSAAGYDLLYRRQLWVGVVIGKRARGVARLPLKVYRHDDLNRPEVGPEDPYAALLHNPNPAISTFDFWLWTSSTFDIYGEAFWLKRRDKGGRPYQLAPLHPTAMTLRDDGLWYFDNGTIRLDRGIRSEDLVHFKTYHPTDTDRGLSALEQLRDTLENERAARTATSSFWANGARPGFALTHPNNLSENASTRLRAQWDQGFGGAKNAGKTLILEEGMEAKILQLTNEEAQYIETRKLNREEVCAAYDIPPPVVHILDHATYSNITEQMRSMYRDTMAPLLKGFESNLDAQLRAPDFAEDVYAEFLMDEVLRGDFEQRAAAYKAADYMTIAEKRRAENLPFIEGTDIILVNTASLPLDRLNDPGPIDAGAADQPAIAPAAEVVSEPAARSVIMLPPAVRLDQTSTRSIMGRLSWQTDVRDVDPHALAAGLPTDQREAVLAAWAASTALGEDVPALKARLRALTTKEIER
jgi:HK97 family phage portal protein